MADSSKSPMATGIVLRSGFVKLSLIPADPTTKMTVADTARRGKQPKAIDEVFKPVPCTLDEWDLAWIDHGMEIICPDTCPVCGTNPLVLPPKGVKRPDYRLAKAAVAALFRRP